MDNLTNALQQLREEREQAQSQVEKLDSAISVLNDLVGRNGARSQAAVGGSRVVTAAARRRMAAAQRARWAKVRQQTQNQQTNKPHTTSSPKRTISAAGRRRIAAAQRARWAKVRAQQRGRKAA
jgi:peptidoglycan hydrolase CwlO-like protein